VTFGAYGTILKHRIEDKFRQFFMHPYGMIEIESSVITPGKVFEASGHLEHFTEPMVECQKCKRRFRADHLLREQAKMSDTETEKLSLKELETVLMDKNIRCPECNSTSWGEPKYFLTMFQTTIGPYSEATGYGRPEAAQGIFVEFKRIYEQEREKLPLGIAQIGHAVRNEISPRQGVIRLREFTIMDVEFFFDPEEPCPWLNTVQDETLCLIPAERKLKNQKEPVTMTAREAVVKGIVKTEWQAFFMALAKQLLTQLGVPEEKQRFIEKLPWEKAHYSTQSFDQEVFLDRWDWTEVSGLAYRTDYDLKRHMQHSGTDMRVYKEYPAPRVREVIAVRPNLAKLGPAFKKDASKIAEKLKDADAEEIQENLEKKGNFTLDGHTILPEHVEITREKVEEKGNRFIPHVVEPSFGSDRLAYIALEYAYECKEDRTFLRLPRDIAPVQVGVFPLMNKDGLSEKATEIAKQLTIEGLSVEYDDSGSIGRRYARMDEIGTPLCITVDYATLKDETVTVRDRDTWKQVRTSISRLPKLLREYFNYCRQFKDLGEPIKE